MKKLKLLIDKQKDAYDKISESVGYRRQRWEPFHERSKQFFSSVISEFKQKPFFDLLHIDDGVNKTLKVENQKWITLYFGGHPTGIKKTEYRSNGDFKSGSLVFEEGGKLHYAQLSNGQVICIIYGCKSELLKVKDEWFVYKKYSNPDEITEKEMINALKIFFWYNRITSYMKGFTIIDTFHLNYFKLKSFTSTPDWNMV